MLFVQTGAYIYGECDWTVTFHGDFHFVDESDFGTFTRQYYLNTVFENVSI